MKKHLLIAAVALVIAAPAAAQTAPAQQHQNPSQHQGMDHSQHGQSQSGQQQSGQQQGHAMGDCCADRNGNGRMDCCENMAPAASTRPAQPQPSANR